MANWTIIREFIDTFSINKRLLVEVVCTCGNTGIRRKSHVLNGRTRMCKNCASKETAAKYGMPSNYKTEEQLFESFYNAIISSNLRKRPNLIFEVSKKYLTDLLVQQNYTCALTGRNITVHGQRSKRTASLDRIDSNIGYIEGNVQWVHKDLNRFKNNYSMTQFTTMCTDVYLHFKSQNK